MFVGLRIDDGVPAEAGAVRAAVPQRREGQRVVRQTGRRRKERIQQRGFQERSL